MRVLTLLAVAALAACSKAPQKAPAGELAEVSFDGAQVADAAVKVAHGERLSWALGCRGCHKQDLQGGYFYERYASNLTRDLRNYSDAQIEHVLRTGIPHDGRDLWGMPSEIFQFLSKADMAALVAHLRTLKPGGKPTQPPLPWTQDGKDEIASGHLKTAAAFVREGKREPVDLGPRHALGRYITEEPVPNAMAPNSKAIATSRLTWS